MGGCRSSPAALALDSSLPPAALPPCSGLHPSRAAPRLQLLVGPERGGHGAGVGQPRGLNQHVVEPVALPHQRLQRLHHVVLGGAADAAVLQLSPLRQRGRVLALRMMARGLYQSAESQKSGQVGLHCTPALNSPPTPLDTATPRPPPHLGLLDQRTLNVGAVSNLIQQDRAAVAVLGGQDVVD